MISKVYWGLKHAIPSENTTLKVSCRKTLYITTPTIFYSGFSQTAIGKSVICSFLFSCKSGKESQTPEPSGAQYNFALIWEPNTYSKYPAVLRKYYQIF